MRYFVPTSSQVNGLEFWLYVCLIGAVIQILEATLNDYIVIKSRLKYDPCWTCSTWTLLCRLQMINFFLWLFLLFKRDDGSSQHANQFNLESDNRLFVHLHELRQRKARFVWSQSKADLIDYVFRVAYPILLFIFCVWYCVRLNWNEHLPQTKS